MLLRLVEGEDFTIEGLGIAFDPNPTPEPKPNPTPEPKLGLHLQSDYSFNTDSGTISPPINDSSILPG